VVGVDLVWLITNKCEKTHVYGEVQGSQNRWEPVRFGRFPVEPVRPGPVPTLKPYLIFLTIDEPAGLTGIPAGFLDRGNRTSHGYVNLVKYTPLEIVSKLHYFFSYSIVMHGFLPTNETILLAFQKHV
jgi:hypothetical protein